MAVEMNAKSDRDPSPKLSSVTSNRFIHTSSCQRPGSRGILDGCPLGSRISISARKGADMYSRPPPLNYLS